MRIALNAVGDIGTRAGKILLAESSLAALGMYGPQEGQRAADRKVMVIRELAGFDVLATDDADLASGLAGIAADDGLSCVTTTAGVDAELGERFIAAGTTLLVGANLADGLAAALTAHEGAQPDQVTSTTAAWTVPGRPVRRGTVIPFPEPIGPRWGRRVGKRRARSGLRRVAVPISGDWAGATVIVEGFEGGQPVTRIIGIADQADHLEAIALAAGVLAVAEGAYAPGLQRPADNASAYLAAALRVGLGIAAFTD